ncbi:BTB/POZ domain-containing protein 6-like [Argopecten irradians]|uniref:BTB/POZ domain-containing protein 6-like n=1 Tax=Argopecten irradians TaxID=31199 RepID=UPI00371299E9
MATSSPPSDWQVGKTLSECFDHLLSSGISSDVTFIVGEEKTRIFAHKLVLLSRSPVFYAMFEGPMAEKGEITIPDISPEIFRIFLRYLYTDNIELTDKNVVPVFNVGRKYCVDILISLCEAFLSNNLTTDNACALLEQAHVFMMESLQEDCFKFIVKNGYDILKSVSFTELSHYCMARITGSDELITIREENVYEAVMRWAEAECSRQKIEKTAENIRVVLGESLYNVRFLHIGEEFFFRRICSDKVITGEDALDIINHRKNKTALTSEKLDKKRRSKTVPKRYYRNGPVFHTQWIAQAVNEAISFKSSVDLYLFGFGSFFTKVDGSSVDFKIYEDEVCLVEDTQPRGSPQPDKPNMGDVLLDTPIRIHAGKTYTVLEHSHYAVQHYFENGIIDVSHEDVTIQFINSSKSVYTNTNRGQIPYVLLSG